MTYVPNNQLIFSSLFNLNSSFTKQVAVGVEFSSKGELISVVKFVSSHPKCNISLDIKDWTIFKKYISIIGEYFKGKETPHEIRGENFNLRFGILHGEATVSLEDRKNKKSFYPFIIKEGSFKIFESLIFCIDHRLKKLSFLRLKKKYRLIVESIAEILCNTNVSSEKETEIFVKKNYKKLLLRLKTKKIFSSHLETKIFFVDIVTFNLRHLSKQICEVIREINCIHTKKDDVTT